MSSRTDSTATPSSHPRFRYTSAPERREQLLRIVEEQGYCAITELSTAFDVSEMTIRRDVTKLVSQGRLRSVHGGVSTLTPQELQGSSYTNRLVRSNSAKWQIATRAVDFVRPGSAIAIDAGTTGAAIAAQLPADAGIRVVTASLSVITELTQKPGIEVTSLGGVLNTDSLSFAGPSTLSAIANLQVETFFLAASSLNERGVFCATDFDAVTKRALIDAATRVIVVADSSKFSLSAMVRVCEWDGISTLVVDSDLSAEAASTLRARGVEIVLAPAQQDETPQTQDAKGTTAHDDVSDAAVTVQND